MGKRKRLRGGVAWLPLVVTLPACTGVVGGEKMPNQQPPSSMGGSAGTGSIGTASCEDDGMGVSIPKRLVRLSYAQLANGAQALLGAEARAAVDALNIVPGAREFQPLFKEGPQISSAVLPKTMRLAEAAAGAAQVTTGCTTGDDACAQQAVLGLAQKAYRRPLTADEQGSLTQLYSELKGHGNTAEQAASLAAQGILLAAPALYRTEFGAAGSGTGRISVAETASQLAYFLSDAPPDAPLLEAAATGALDSDDGVRAQVDRLLQTAPVRENLKQAMLAYFEVADVLVDVKDGALYPEYTQGMRLSLLRESELFLEETLYGSKLSDLLTSRRGFVNKVVAPIYGVAYPGPASDLDDVFLPIELPEQRAGLLTRGAILAMRSRPNDTSVVSRGLFVNATLLCAEQPPEPPASVLGDVGKQLEDTTTTEKDKAVSRANTSPCSGCHQYFDPYGLALESYDAIGRYRTSYASFPNMPAIDTSSQLPEVAGGAQVKNLSELVDVVTQNGRFSQCMAVNLMRYALSDDSLLPSEDCGVVQLNERFRATDQSFVSLVREIAVAPITTTRVAQ